MFEKFKPPVAPSIVLKAATSLDETEWAQGLGNVAAGIWQVDLNASQQAHATAQATESEGGASEREQEARVVTFRTDIRLCGEGLNGHGGSSRALFSNLGSPLDARVTITASISISVRRHVSS